MWKYKLEPSALNHSATHSTGSTEVQQDSAGSKAGQLRPAALAGGGQRLPRQRELGDV